MGAWSSPIYKCALWGELITLWCCTAGTMAPGSHCDTAKTEWWCKLQNGMTHPCHLMQNPVTEGPHGEVGRPSCWNSPAHICEALNHSLQLKALRQRGTREASYSLHHVSLQAAQKSTEAAGDLRCFLDLILKVSRDMTWSSSLAPNPTAPWNQQIQDHELSNTGVLKVPQE